MATQDEINLEQKEENANTNRNIDAIARSQNQSNQVQGAKNELQTHINEEVKDDIKTLYDHAKVANEEMGAMAKEMATLKADVSWLVNGFKDLGIKVWAIVAGILISIGMSIMNLLK